MMMGCERRGEGGRGKGGNEKNALGTVQHMRETSKYTMKEKKKKKNSPANIGVIR